MPVRSKSLWAFAIITPTWEETYNVTQGKVRLDFVRIARESRSDGSCFGYLVHATWGHSAILGILHGILLWYCPNCHQKMEKLALL